MKKQPCTLLHYLSCLFFFLLSFSLDLTAQLRADFSLDRASGCAPLAVSFTNRTTGASGSAIYKWDFGNGNTSILANPGAIFTEEKTYTVTLTVTDGGQTATRSATVTVYKRPTVDFSSAAPKVCLPQAVTFNANVSAGDGFINGYHWDFGDGTSQQGFGNQITHFYPVEQTPTVSLTVTNSHGCSNSITKSTAVEILPRINPSFTVDNALLCTLSDAATFTNTSTGPGTLRYLWEFGDGTTSTEKDPSHVYTAKGVHTTKLTVSNTDGCTAQTSRTVNAAYFNTDFSSRLLCREATFTPSSHISPSSTLWQFGDATTATRAGTTSHIYTTAGTYTVKLINTYGGCKDSVSKTITLNDVVNFNTSIESPSQVCKDNIISFTSKSTTTPSNSAWELGDGYVYNWSSQVSHQYKTADTYTVKLTNTFGTCKETVTKQIAVLEKPEPKGFVIDLGGICGAPVTARFKDTTAGAVSWKWEIYQNWATTTFSTQQNPTYNFTTDGTYWVYLTVTNASGCSQTVTKSFTIARPVINIQHTYSSSPAGRTYDCDSLRLTLAAYGNQPLQDYHWNFGDGNSSTAATPTHTYNKEGIYVITLNYTTELGCKGTATYTARVYGKPKAAFNYTIPCGNSLNLQFYDRSFFSDNWYWQFAPNNYSYYSSSPVVAFNDTGKYNVKFVSHIGHCSDTIEQVIHANVLPSLVAITKVEKTCEGDYGTVTFDQRSLRISSGTWNFGDGTTIPYDTSVHIIKHTYTKTGNYTVTLTGISGNCTLTDSRTINILLKQKPTLTANKTEMCASDNLSIQIGNLQANPISSSQWGQYYVSKLEYDDGKPHTGFYNYDWNFTNFSGVLQSLPAGVTKLRAIVTPSGYNCPDTTNYINIKVNGPVAGFKIASNNICYKTPFVFEDTSKSVTSTPLKTWHWDFGDGTTLSRSTGGQVSHLYTNPGNYNVRLTVTDASGCTVTFMSTAHARGPKAAFQPIGPFVPNVPLKSTVNFQNNSITWYSNSVDFTWKYGEGPDGNTYYGSYTYNTAGTYTVTLIARDPSISCADTTQKVINVKDFNTAFTFSTTYLTNASCPPVMVRINNLSVGFTSLKWDFGDGTTTETQNYPSHIYTKPGTYKITLKTYGFNGLTGTYIDSVVVKAPTAQLSADVLQGCTSQTVALKSNAQNTNTYVWDFGDGTLQTTGTNATHTFITPGLYKPRLIVKDDKGCTVASELAGNVVIDDLAIAIKGIPSLLCDEALIEFKGDVTSFAADRLQKALIYKWDFGTGNPADVSTDKNPRFRYNKPGTYKVKLRVESPYGCIKEVTETVVVTEKAKGTIKAVPESCEGSSVQFTATASSAGALQWEWLFGNGQTSTLQNPAAQLYNTPGSYDVRLVINKNGCYDTTFHQLAVHAKPVVNLNPKQAIVCLGNTLPLSAQGGGTYTWSPAAGLSNPAIANPIAKPTADVMYKVQVTSPKGCISSDSMKVTVARPIKVQLTNETYICKNGQVALTATGATSYQWINNTVGLSNTQVPNPIAKPQASTTYTLVGYDAHNCFTDTARVLVSVQQPPTINAGPDGEITGGTPYQLNATGSSDITEWLWAPSHNLSCATCPAPISTAQFATTYIVTAKNRYGCTATDTMLLKVKCAPDYIYIPNGFSPNNDGKNDVFLIKGSGAYIRHLRIYNRWGQVVFERSNFSIDDTSKSWNGWYNGYPAPEGTYVYMAELECSGGEVFTRKGTITLMR